jgi:hypothetical protein
MRDGGKLRATSDDALTAIGLEARGRGSDAAADDDVVAVCRAALMPGSDS